MSSWVKKPEVLWRGRLLVAPLLACLCTACANMSDREQAQAQGAGIGVVVGGVLGALLGGEDRGTGAAVGAAIGGIAGAAYGDSVSDRKERRAAAEDELGASIAAAEQALAQARTFNDSVLQDIARLQKDRQALRSKTASAEERSRALEAERRQVSEMIQRSERELSQLSTQIAAQQRRLDASASASNQGGGASDGDGLRRVRDGVAGLRTERSRLEQALSQLRQIDRRRAY